MKLEIKLTDEIDKIKVINENDKILIYINKDKVFDREVIAAVKLFLSEFDSGDILGYPFEYLSKDFTELVDFSRVSNLIFRNGIYYLDKEEYTFDKNKWYVTCLFIKSDKKNTKEEIDYGYLNNKDYNEYLLKKEKQIYKKIPFTQIKIKLLKLKKIVKLNKIVKK